MGQLEQIIRDTDPEKIGAAIDQRADEWAEKKAAKAARNETVRIANYTALETWMSEGIRKKVWVTYGKNCPYCNKMSGKVIEIEKNFLKAGDAIHAEYDVKNEDGTTDKKWGSLSIKTNMAHPPAHLGCDCGISYA